MGKAEPPAVQIALAGALIATAGDVSLLVAGSGHIAVPSAAFSPVVFFGTLLGVAGIPLYQLGYWHEASLASNRAPKLAFWLRLGGTLFSGTGAAVHAATGLSIAAAAGSAPPPNPYEAILQGGPTFLGLWALAAAAFFLATIPHLMCCHGGKDRLANPLVVTVLILGLSLLLPSAVGNVLGPASVNIAHIVFFWPRRASATRSAPANTEHVKPANLPRPRVNSTNQRKLQTGADAREGQ